MSPPLTRAQLEALVLAMNGQIEEACHAIAAILDHDQIEPLPASVDRLICALADAREKLEAYEAGGSWPSDLGEPLRCGTLAALASPPQTGILEWRDGLPVRPTQQEKT